MVGLISSLPTEACVVCVKGSWVVKGSRFCCASELVCSSRINMPAEVALARGGEERC